MQPVIVCLEDDPDILEDTLFALGMQFPDAKIVGVTAKSEFLSSINSLDPAQEYLAGVVSDNNVTDGSAIDAIIKMRETYPYVPVVFHTASFVDVRAAKDQLVITDDDIFKKPQIPFQPLIVRLSTLMTEATRDDKPRSGPSSQSTP